MGTLKCDTIVDGAGTGAPSFTYGISGTTPTQQRFTSGSGTYTTPANCKWIRVRMTGGGQGGSGGGTVGTAGKGGVSTAPTASTFGSSLLTCNPGATHDFVYGVSQGGTATINSPAFGTAIQGGDGSGAHSWTSAVVNLGGGTGGGNAFGGFGVGGDVQSGVGRNGRTNTGGGGGGGACSGSATSSQSGSGGGASGYIDAIIVNPSASYSYTVGVGGSAGTAGTNGSSGGAGGSGYIEVTEFYA